MKGAATLHHALTVLGGAGIVGLLGCGSDKSGDGDADTDTDSDTGTGCRDLDGDGHEDRACGGFDCDDTNELVFPGACAGPT